MNFKDLEFHTHALGVGKQALVFFKNGYGASVIKTPFSYGGAEGKYELAVLVGNKKSYEIYYNSPLTDDVLGYLSAKDVTKKLVEIENLPKYFL